jgi:hypothetical protein
MGACVVVGVAAADADADADGAGIGSGVDATGAGGGVGVGVGFGAACVASVLCASGAISVVVSVLGGSLAHPASAIDAAAVRATAMLPEVELAARAQNGHDVSDT